MDKRQLNDLGALTSFNILAEGDEETLISKLFSKFRTAVANTNESSPIPIKGKKPEVQTALAKEIDLPESFSSLEARLEHIPLTKTSSAESDNQSVLTNFSVSNTNSLNRMLNRLRGGEMDSGSKEFWMPDEQCRECTDCKSPFNLFKRKHHCRTCGRIFCSKCLDHLIHTSHTVLRVCNECYTKVEDKLWVDDNLVQDETVQEDSDEEFERGTHSFEIQRPNLDLHFSLSTSSHPEDTGIKKLLTSTFLRAPRSRTISMSSLAEPVEKMPFRRNSSHENTEDDEDRKGSRHLLNFLGTERPASGIFNNFFFEEAETPTPSTSTGSKKLFRSERPPRRRLSLTDPALLTRRVRTTSLMRNAPIMMGSTTAQPEHAFCQPEVPVIRWDPSFLDLMQSMLRHCLQANQVQVKVWEDTLLQLLRTVADHVQPRIRIRDTFDMNHYVKIKRVAGGLAKDSFSVRGVVLSKNVAHKQMVRKIENPRIMIINFDLEGLAEINHEYLKLDRLMAWERDHRKVLVDQIISLKPSIVLVAGHVPRTVIDLLNKAGIVVAYKIKRQKLDAIARCADIAIFNYKNDLWNTKSVAQGRCKLFETMTFMHEWLPNRRKTFLLFRDCPQERGATILLRGGEQKTLAVIKNIMRFMVQVVNNLVIEAQLRKDFIELRQWQQLPPEENAVRKMASFAEDAVDAKSVSALSVAESHMTTGTMADLLKKKLQQEPVVVEDDDLCLTAINTVLKQYQNTMLSISPGVTLPVPHILIKLRDAQKKLIAIIRERLGSTELDEEGKPVPIPSDLNQMLDYFKIFECQLENNAEYRHYQDLHIHNWYNFKKYIREASLYLSPLEHQEILVHRTIYPMDDHTIPCHKIVAEPYRYYDPTCDYTLGQYILNAAKEAYKPCTSKMCRSPLMFHDVTFSHGNAQIKVQVFHEVDDEQGMVEEHIEIDKDEYLHQIPIFFCTFCKLCEINQPWRPMSDLLQRYSFGKFLELLFYQSVSVLLDEEDSGCPHGLYREHTLSFRIQNYTVNFTHAMVKVVEVIPPPIHTCFSSTKQFALKDKTLDAIRAKLSRFFDSIVERNKSFVYDVVQPSMIDACKESLQDMSQEATKTKKSLLQKLQMEYATSLPTDTIALNNVLAELQNHVVNWDLKYVEFARRFIRPERELRRLTASHLRKMFPAESLSSDPNLNLRTKRAVDAVDLPLLDIMEESATHQDLLLKEQPTLGESPTQSFPWFDELQQFDKKFLSHADEEVLDPSVARRLSLELMKEPRIHSPMHEKPKFLEIKNVPAQDPRATQNVRSVFVQQLPTAYQRLTGLLPEPSVHRSKSSPSTGPPIRHRRTLSHHKLESKTLRQTFYESSHLEEPVQSYRGYTKAPASSYRYGFVPNRTPKPRPKKPMMPSHLPVPVSRRKLSGTRIKEIPHHDTSSDEEFDDSDEEEPTPFRHTTFSLVHMDEYDECMGRESVPSISELERFNREHELQMANNTLPFLSLEMEKKDNPTNVLDPTRPVNLDWNTNDTGKNSIMKAITYVLAEKSISNWTPLDYPFSSTEHIFADSNILVREDEPSSIISYMLASTFYREKLVKRQSQRISKVAGVQETKSVYSQISLDEEKVDYSEMFPDEETERPWRFSFKGGSTSFTCKIYYAEQFDMFRKSCGCGETFIQSLARCSVWDTAGGKSGASFLKTKDERFLIKQISKFEMDAFVGSANKYFMYMFNEVFEKGIPTVLCKIFGLYRIGFYNNVSGKSMKMDILVMENLFYEHSVKMVYDLKGSLRNRYASKTGKNVEVLLDENLVEMISKTPLYMRVDTKNNLTDSLYNDTQFLVQIDVMDYSLLVGFDDEKNQIIVGIVDFFRTYTWDKKLESWVKESGMLGGVKRDPTIISPKMYRRRFRSAIDLYFVMIPDFWTLLHNN
ncbi:hypothetical protein BY458DRAFT_462342 [Sporodiniella umbellata]|nr:hypothetical protein BY458DRAFT_462342 [Sporodiniella umbellata]